MFRWVSGTSSTCAGKGIITGGDWLFAVLYMAVFGAVFMQAIRYKLL
jgi:hypothetical protein